jgi:nucleotide-binding universal stress UspA family protein
VSGVRRVIAGVSGSPGSLQALRFAASLARVHDAALVPVLIWLPPGGDFADRSHPSPVLRKIWKDAARRRLWSAIELAFGALPEDLTVQLAVLRGEPGLVLTGTASQPGDVLVIGAGRRGAGRLMGSRISRYCLAHAHCPVLAVPPSALARIGSGPRGWMFRHRGLDPELAALRAD